MFRGQARSQDALPVRLFPFVASSTAAYVVEVGENYLRFWNNNSPVLTRADAIGKPGVISAVGDILVLATPYSGSILFELQLCVANDVCWLVQAAYPVYRLVRYAADGFYFEQMTFVQPPLQDENILDITLAASGDLTKGATVNLVAVGGDVFDALDVGAYYGIDHRRPYPFAEISLSQGSGTATALLIFSGNAVAGETVTIGTGSDQRVYTWDSEGAYGVPVGATQADSAANIVKAINGAVGANPGTQAHPSVTASNLGAFTTGIKAAGILSFTDNDLTAGGSPDQFLIGGQAYTWSLDVTSGAAYHVKVGATLADSIANAILAINATGAAGVNYTAGTLANTDVAADAAATGSTLRVQALAAGSTGNSITTTVAHTSRMSWGSPTLTGGADSSTNQVQITARIEGAAGNAIALAETMTNAAWQPAGFMAGGADNTSFDPSNPSAVIPTVRVDGTWEVYTLGRWYGTLTLQQQRTTGEWETVRTWDSQNDKNYDATGTVDGEKVMRLIFVGSAIADDDAPARAVLTATDAIVHGLVLITSVTDSTHATGTVIQAIFSTDPTYLWSHGSWNERYGYPSAVALHQQRLVFGQRARIFGSQTGGFDNFERNDLADSSYQYELAATVATNITSLQSQAGLVILTETDEWLADGGSTGAVITPAGIRTQQLTSYGSIRTGSQIVHNNVIFIQAGGIIANEYLFDFGQQNYEAVDLGELADHLTREVLVQIAWAPVPHSLIYFVTQKGSLLSLAYRRRAGNANEGGILAWSKNVTPDASTGGTGVIESVCVVPGSNEVSDVWVSVRRQLPDASFIRTLESYDVSYWDNLTENSAASIANLCLLDGAVKNTTLLPIDPTVTGLDHLEGMTVAVLLNGFVHPDRTVEGGQITLDMSGIEPPTVSTAVVGLAPLAQIQPWFATVQMRDGGSDGRSFNVGALNARWYLTGAAQQADDNEGAKFYTIDFRKGTDDISLPTPLLTGLKRWTNAGRNRDDTEVIYRNRSALPMNLAGVTLEMEITSHK